MIEEKDIFGRTALVAGDEMMARLKETRVILFGVGGVGSWCAEALIRSGVGHLTMVDFDTVAASNINRQLPATTETVGMEKTEVLRERLLAINPHAEVRAIRGVYSPETAASFDIETYDYAIDAIDSLANKADLVLRCTSPETAPRRAFFSSMGAALKLHAGAIDVAEFRKVVGCPLARALRNRFKKDGRMPRRKFLCVYSPERLSNRKAPEESATEAEGGAIRKGAPNGTFAHTTAIFGLRLAGLVIEKEYEA
ncbi:MAG: tRNA threonylcarbamoyladenosine dehydratase [Muribaculaceae bacterium]|nr:tRNA threonylcarbamoyladenosine dehydratase [Muribaculaceae bacterium]